MDRKSNQKVGAILIISVIFIVSTGILLYCSIRHESRLRDAQMQELVVIYPEIETQLHENFMFYNGQSVQTSLIFAGIAMSMAAGLCVVLYLIWKQEKKEIRREISEETDAIYEQLQRFQKGDFTMLPIFDVAKDENEWVSIHEKLRELGYYFSELKERLEEEENSTKALITDISHQLKTPLASLRMSHELAESEHLSSEERGEFLYAQTREINKLDELLDELMKLSRLENHMIQIKPEKNSLKQTITEAVSQVFMKAYDKNMEIIAEIEKDAEILIDRKWTIEALVNVLENAVKYSEAGTNIVIRTTCLTTNVLIEIEDEGIGILEEELHKIFRRFYRGSKAKEKMKDGAGIGLYLARNILEQQGGTILARRKVGNGTIFKIMLPFN